MTIALGAIVIWLYVDNRALHRDLDERPPKVGESLAQKNEAASLESDAPRPIRVAAIQSRSAPALPPVHLESWLERSNRRTGEIAALLGRADGESDDAYRARMKPLVAAALAVPRARTESMRKDAEVSAHVTPDQSRQIDAAMSKVYDSAIDYANQAIGSGLLSPYEHNVGGWLEAAGGLGAILNTGQSQLGQILSEDQLKAMSSAGFDWGEYIGLQAPWESLKPPPAPK